MERQTRSTIFLSLLAVVIAAFAYEMQTAASDSQPDAFMWDSLKSLALVQEGSDHPDHILYAVVDPNCPYCHELWSTMQKRYASGKLQVRYILVGTLTTTSRDKAATILESAQPVTAFDLNERSWGQLRDDSGGGMAPSRKPSEATLKAVDANERLVSSLGIEGTPALIFVDYKHKLHVTQGYGSPAMLDQVINSASAAN